MCCHSLPYSLNVLRSGGKTRDKHEVGLREMRGLQLHILSEGASGGRGLRYNGEGAVFLAFAAHLIQNLQ